jgi:transaldolase
MKPNPLLELRRFGQQVWLDYIRRDLIAEGRLAAMVHDDGLAGITSNPSIFEDAIAHHHCYDGRLAELRAQGADALQAYQDLTTEDVRLAADVLLPQWRASGGSAGLVSLEVAPDLADDVEATVREARALRAAVGRDNLMVKVPGTRAGLAAIERLIGEGLNINVTLLFSVSRYRAVVDAFLDGLEARLRRGLPVAGIQSVASFFISRIDTLVDARIDALATRDVALRSLRGTAAVVSARLAYAHYLEWTDGARWRRLAAAGASPQRLLWASTSTKDPAYSDVRYVEELIAPDTITTLPPATLDAYRDHGDPAARLALGLAEAPAGRARLAAAGIDLEEVAEQLEREGVEKFAAARDSLLATLAERLGG